MTEAPPFPTLLDSSILSTYRACGRKFYWNYLRRKEPAASSIHLHAGGAFASAIEAARRSFYIDHRPQQTAEAVGLYTLLQAYGIPEDWDEEVEIKSAHRLSIALLDYFIQFPFATDTIQPASLGGKPAIEFSFALPLPLTNPSTGEPIIYAGRTDMIGEFQKAQWIVDEKTTSRLGPTWSGQWGLRGQFLGYNWSAREHGWHTVGTIVRGIAIRKSGIEIVSAIVPSSDHLISLWYTDTIHTISQMILDYNDDYWRYDFGDACTNYNGCPYSRLCTSPNPEAWISTYYRDNTWNPLDRPSPTPNLLLLPA